MSARALEGDNDAELARTGPLSPAQQHLMQNLVSIKHSVELSKTLHLRCCSRRPVLLILFYSIPERDKYLCWANREGRKKKEIALLGWRHLSITPSRTRSSRCPEELLIREERRRHLIRFSYSFCHTGLSLYKIQQLMMKITLTQCAFFINVVHQHRLKEVERKKKKRKLLASLLVWWEEWGKIVSISIKERWIHYEEQLSAGLPSPFIDCASMVPPMQTFLFNDFGKKERTFFLLFPYIIPYKWI